MSVLLFIDESGYDLHESPYAVLAGLGIPDKKLWPLIGRIHDAEYRFFGQRMSDGFLELKAKKLLKTKTFRHASMLSAIGPIERTAAARSCLEKGRQNKGVDGGGGATQIEIVSLAQAKIAFVEYILSLCAESRIKVFASIVPREAPFPESTGFLRKDYAYLLERYYYFLMNHREDPMGLVVFDELERSQCHILIDQMERYFRETATGSARASYIIPEPFFVHSDLTTAIQLADIVAYIISWGLRLPGMTAEPRVELETLASIVRGLQYTTQRRDMDGSTYKIWSYKVISDLRPKYRKNQEKCEDE